MHISCIPLVVRCTYDSNCCVSYIAWPTKRIPYSRKDKQEWFLRTLRQISLQVSSKNVLDDGLTIKAALLKPDSLISEYL